MKNPCPDLEEEQVAPDPKCFDDLRGTNVIKDINVPKSSGLTNVSSFIIKEVFLLIIP